MFLSDSKYSTSVWGVFGVPSPILLPQILGGGFKDSKNISTHPDIAHPIGNPRGQL